MEGATHFIEVWTLDGGETYQSLIQPIEVLKEFTSLTKKYLNGYTIAIFYIKPKKQ